MPYLNVDDAYPDHPKVEGLSDAAYRLHGAVMFYAARYRLDGRLTAKQLRARTRWGEKTQAELVDAELLHPPGTVCRIASEHCPADDGQTWRLHDYFQWNKSRAWWDNKRSANVRRQTEWRARQDELQARRERTT